MNLLENIALTMRASGAVYCNRSCRFVGVWLGVFVGPLPR